MKKKTHGLVSRFCKEHGLQRNRIVLWRELEIGIGGYRLIDTLVSYDLYKYHADHHAYLYETHVESLDDALAYIYNISTPGQFCELSQEC